MARRRYLSPDLPQGPDCTCYLEAVHPTDLDPPETILNPDCPEHGSDDSDRLYEEYRDRRSAEAGERDDDWF